MTILIKHRSAWTFVTSATGGLGVEFLAASGGAIYLQDPTGKPETFHYGAVGAGLSAGLKLPKIGKIQIKGKSVGAAGAPASFPNAGVIYVTEALKGAELTRSDIQGATVFLEGSGGLVAGIGGNAMLLGINSVALVAAMGCPPMLMPVLLTAPAILVSGGVNVGIQAGAGVALFGGYLH